jgi:signal transduction histidine kinase
MPEPDNERMTAFTRTAAFARAAVREPFTRRAHRELVFCLVAGPLGFGILCVLLWEFAFAAAVFAVDPEFESTWVTALAMVVGGLLLILFANRAARALGRAYRGLAARLLGERIPVPPSLPRARGIGGRLAAGLRDGPGWRAVAYVLVRLPFAVFECYAAYLWVGGLINLTYPFWWGLFRNHPPGTRLSPVLVFTPFPGRVPHVGTFPGTFLALAIGVAMVLAAPWATRAAVSMDRRLLRGLLGPGGLAQRVHDLEQTRSLAVEDTAALLRQVERDLHDGAQVRLAALALNLGMAKEKLGGDDDAPDLAALRELVDAAHRGAKDALIELRDLARGLHPPALDNGLADALATLAAGSAIPVELTTHIPARPTPAIETIAYFCAAELLTNAAKHSHASKIEIRAMEREGTLVLTVADDGIGGADPAGGSGLSGLTQRVSTVDGRLDINSPLGGPTRIVVELPMRT